VDYGVFLQGEDGILAELLRILPFEFGRNLFIGDGLMCARYTRSEGALSWMLPVSRSAAVVHPLAGIVAMTALAELCSGCYMTVSSSVTGPYEYTLCNTEDRDSKATVLHLTSPHCGGLLLLSRTGNTKSRATTPASALDIRQGRISLACELADNSHVFPGLREQDPWGYGSLGSCLVPHAWMPLSMERSSCQVSVRSHGIGLPRIASI
jgi:hypothetical protein